MQVQCPNCATKYPVDERKVPPQGVNLRCVQCGTVFPVKLSLDLAPTAPSPNLALDQGLAEDPDSDHTQVTGTLPLAASSAASGIELESANDALERANFGAHAPHEAHTPSPGYSGPSSLPPASASSGSPASSPSTLPPSTLPPAAQPRPGPTPAAVGTLHPTGAQAADPLSPAMPSELDDPFGDLTAAPAPPAPTRDSTAEKKAIPDDFKLVEVSSGPTATSPAPKRPTSTEASAKPSTGESTRVNPKYYVRKANQKVFGPFDIPTVAELLSKGELTGDEQISADRESWKSISGIPEFAAAIKAASKATSTVKRSSRLGDLAPRQRILAIVGAAALLGVVLFGIFTITGRGLTGAGFSSGETGEDARTLSKGLYSGFRDVYRKHLEELEKEDADAEKLALFAHAGYYLARIYGEKPKLNDAGNALAKKSSDDTDRVYAIARAHQSIAGGDASLARDVLNRLRERLPDDAEVLFLLGEAAFIEKDFATARTLYEKAGQLDPTFALPRHRIGDSYAGVSDDKAMAAYRDALKAEPRHQISAVRLVALLGTGKPAFAEVSTLCQAINDGGALEISRSEFDEARFICARAMIENGKRTDAMTLLALVSQEAGARVEHLTLYGSLLLDEKKPADAEKAYKRALDQDAKSEVAATGYIRALLAQRKVVEALKVVETSLAAMPKSAPVHYMAARASLEVEKADDALRLLTAAIELQPDYLDAHLLRISTLSAEKRIDEAEKVLEAARALSPNAAPVVYATADIYYHRGEYAKAAEALEPLKSSAPEYIDAFLLLGRSYLNLKKPDNALVALRIAEKINPDLNGLDLELGRTLSQMKDYDAALKSFKRALERESDLSRVESEIGLTLYAMGNFDDARTHFTQAISLDRRNAQAHYGRGLVYRAQNDLNSSLSNFRQATMEDPDTAAYYREFGAVALQTNQLADASYALDKAITLDPEDARAFELYGETLLKMRNYTKAIEKLERVVQISGERADLWSKVATVWYQQRNFKEAARAYEKAVRLDPRLPGAYLRLANCYGSLSREEDRMSALARSIEHDPDQTQAYYDLAVLYKERGDVDRSQKYARDCVAAEERIKNAPAKTDATESPDSAKLMSFEEDCQDLLIK